MCNLAGKAAAWNVTIEETRETDLSVLGFGVRNGRRVVLKLARAADEARSGEVLKAFEGDGAVRVYEHDHGAVLMERLDPGEQLVSLVRRGHDDQATLIIAQVIEKLANHTPPPDCPTVADWGRGFDRYEQSGDQTIPAELVRKAKHLYADLAASQRSTMLLHGDLQHYNVLFDNNRGWTAIDPKGVVGEMEYEIGALMRNPVEQPELVANCATVEGRLEILTSLLPLDYQRTLRWSFAQAVLSAIWDIEDGYEVKSNHHALLVAQSLRSLVR